MRQLINKTEDKMNQGNSIEIIEGEYLSPHDKAVLESGKTLLIDSISTAREFCHSMIGYSAGAIPIYLGIMAFIFPENYTLGVTAGIVVAFPAIMFLLASIAFTVGYLPIKTEFSLDLYEEIERERNKIIQHRSKLIIIGFSIFTIGTLSAILVLVINIVNR